MYGYIYLIVNKLDGRTYVGKRKSSKEWFEDKYMGSGVHLKLAQKKYGLENFEKFLICYTESEKDACEKEEFWIAHYRELNKAEYNIADGGKGNCGWKPSEQTKINMSKPRTEEHKRHIGESMKGSKRTLGYRWATEQKENLKKKRGNSWCLVDGKRHWYTK